MPMPLPKCVPASAWPATFPSSERCAPGNSHKRTFAWHAIATACFRTRRNPMANRWWVYQRERFPVVSYGLLVAVFSLSALTYSTLARAQARWPQPGAFLVAAVCAFLFFLELRIFDEWKDYEDDLRYRPYRAVPRGLVTLSELRTLWAVAAVIQLAFVIWWDVRL